MAQCEPKAVHRGRARGPPGTHPGNCLNRSPSMALVVASGKPSTNRMRFGLPAAALGAAPEAGPAAASSPSAPCVWTLLAPRSAPKDTASGGQRAAAAVLTGSRPRAGKTNEPGCAPFTRLCGGSHEPSSFAMASDFDTANASRCRARVGKRGVRTQRAECEGGTACAARHATHHGPVIEVEPLQRSQRARG